MIRLPMKPGHPPKTRLTTNRPSSGGPLSCHNRIHEVHLDQVGNQPAPGTYFSIIGSGLMLAGSLIALRGAASHAKPADEAL